MTRLPVSRSPARQPADNGLPAARRLTARALLAVLAVSGLDAVAYELLRHDGLVATGELNVRAGFRRGDNINFGLGAVQGFGSLTSTGETSRNDLQMAIKPGLNVEYALDTSTLYGGLTAVAATTTLDGELSGQFARSGDQVTDTDAAYVGWRNGWLDLSYGGREFTVGDGFIVGDGNFNQGHDNGQYWIGAFTAWRNTGVLKINTSPVRGDLFWLRTDGDLGDSRVAGINVENADSERWGRLGLMYFEVFDDNGVIGFNGLEVSGVRGADLHLPTLPQLKLYAEYVNQGGTVERTGAKVDANAWYVEPTWQFTKLPWTPRLYYRYAHFSGDEAGTPQLEEYRGLFFTIFKRDWDTWYQGEVTGEFHLFNQNQRSQMAKIKVFPTARSAFGFWYYHHALDTPQYFGVPTAGNTEWADELNVSFEYYPSDRLYYFAGFAVAAPAAAAQAVYGHNKTQTVVETFVSYTFR
jgi:hypothetical protein